MTERHAAQASALRERYPQIFNNELPRSKLRGINQKLSLRLKRRGIKPLSASGGLVRLRRIQFSIANSPIKRDLRFASTGLSASGGLVRAKV